MKFDLNHLKKGLEISPWVWQDRREPLDKQKKQNPGVLINNGSYMLEAKKKITKFQGFFSHGLQDSYRKGCNRDNLPQNRGCICF